MQSLISGVPYGDKIAQISPGSKMIKDAFVQILMTSPAKTACAIVGKSDTFSPPPNIWRDREKQNEVFTNDNSLGMRECKGQKTHKLLDGA